MQKNVLSVLKWILLAALLFALVGGLCRIIPIALFYVSSISYFDADYKSYAEEFDLVAEYVYALYPDSGAEPKVLHIRRNDETQTAELYEIVDVLKDAKHCDLPLPEDVSKALYTVYDAFLQKASLSYLWIGEGRVEFRPDVKPYGLAYSPSGRPKGERIEHARHIKGAWYHVNYS